MCWRVWEKLTECLKKAVPRNCEAISHPYGTQSVDYIITTSVWCKVLGHLG